MPARTVLLVALALVVSGCALPTVQPPLPPAAAPPAAGAALPVLDLDAPGRGADQLAAWAGGLAGPLHGSFGGSRLDQGNRAEPPIRGAALDGGPGVGEIRDTDGGALDGDTTFDRAVGPMQFIPATWARWGADADADGVSDPDDLDDAALAAARYLCASGGDLGTSQGWNRAVLTYNRSSRYVQDVLDRAASYAAGRSA